MRAPRTTRCTGGCGSVCKVYGPPIRWTCRECRNNEAAACCPKVRPCGAKEAWPERLHPLHDPSWIDRVVRATGRYFDPARRTGRSTVQALRYIATAMNHPYVWFDVRDHSGVRAADEALLRRIMEMVELLGFEHFQFDARTVALRFGRANET